jgi:hypothetical protein
LLDLVVEGLGQSNAECPRVREQVRWRAHSAPNPQLCAAKQFVHPKTIRHGRSCASKRTVKFVCRDRTRCKTPDSQRATARNYCTIQGNGPAMTWPTLQFCLCFTRFLKTLGQVQEFICMCHMQNKVYSNVHLQYYVPSCQTRHALSSQGVII